MIIPPKYRLTPEISGLLSSIEASREVIESITIPPEIEMNIRRESTLKSSLFSARIEGNTLVLNDLNTVPSHDQKKLEVSNVLKALNWVYDKKRKKITASDVLTLHKITMKNLIDAENLGKFRRNMEAIFNSSGIAIYMPPPPRLVPSFIEKIIKYSNSPKEKLVPIRAILTHYSFEKIHPFLDGSGRVGRLLMQLILSTKGYGMKGILPLEEYLDNHRSEYYRMLEEPEKDATDYVEFMLTAIAGTAENAKKLFLEKREFDNTDLLLPRRKEILELIKEHKMLNFDQVRRRFIKINERTLRYDLKKLQDGKLIKKLGTTRGVYYSADFR
jgi:Fic family protein